MAIVTVQPILRAYPKGPLMVTGKASDGRITEALLPTEHIENVAFGPKADGVEGEGSTDDGREY